MSNPPISLIFVNFRSASRLAAALESLHRFPLPLGTELILVNNDAGEEERLEELSRTYGAKLLHAAGNEGFGSAINRGAAAATGRLLGFLNPDVIFTASVIERVAERVGGKEIAGLRLLTPEGRAQPHDHGSEATLGWLISNHFGRRSAPSGAPVAWVSGCAMFVSRDFFQALEGFDRDFFLYYEDIDLCRRARQAGGAIRYLGDLSLVHLSGSSHVSRTSQKNAYFRSQRAYFRKHRPLWERFLLPFFQAVKRLFA